MSLAPTALLDPRFAPSPAGAPPAPLGGGAVRRDRLVRRLAQSRGIPFAVVRAPAGYGKSTLLRQWAERDGRPFVWLPAADVPAAAALEQAARALNALPEPAVVVLDGADVRAGSQELQAWARDRAAESQLVIATRGEPSLPLGSLRAQGLVLELGAPDLALTRREAAALLSLAGVELDPADVAALLRHTEGWPAALSVAALSIRRGRDPHAAVTGFAGDDRLMADYLRDEVLARLPATAVAFLLRTSVLARLSGPVCDAVLGSTGSGTTLRDLSRGGIPLVPLDDTDDEYRHHPLLAEMLRAEQRRRDPASTAELHRRAGSWLEQEGEIDTALAHAVAAGDLGEAGARLWAIAPTRIAQGRASEVTAWVGAFRDEQVAAHPTLALTAAATHLADGDRDRMEHWVDTAERLISAGHDAPAGSAAAIAALRATVARTGLAAMTGDATTAYEGTDDADAWRPLACLLRGAGLHLLGDQRRAVALLEEGARRGGVTAPSVQVLCLAQLALVRADDGDWEQAALLAARARAQVDGAGLETYPTSALVYAVSALVRAHRERVEAAQEDRRDALALLERLVDAAPWYAVEARVALARATLRLGDPVGSRELLAQAEQLLPSATDAPLAARWLEDGRRQVDAFAASVAGGPASLTTAELRVLRLLPTHLSFREMGLRLHVTANTVKTHAHAVYRKLDACSRSEAVLQARGMGLLDG